MLINRRTFVVKRGCMHDVVALLKAERKQGHTTYRIYTPHIAPFDVIIIDFEFENLAAYEKKWHEWFTSPESAEFMERWYELTENGGTNEIWNLIE